MSYELVVDRAAEGGLVLHCFNYPQEARGWLTRAPAGLFGSHCQAVARCLVQLLAENRPMTPRNLTNVGLRLGYDQGYMKTAILIMTDGDSQFMALNPERCVKSIQEAYLDRNRRQEVGELEKLVSDPEGFRSKLEAILRREQSVAPQYESLPEVESVADLNALDDVGGAEPVLGNYVLHRTGLMFIHAEDGAGKSLLAMQLAGALASGRKWLNWQARENLKVLYLQGELSRWHWQKRSRSLVDEMHDTLPLLSWCHDRWALTTWDFRTRVQKTEGLSKLSRLVELHRPDVLMIDPLTKYYGIAENDNDQNREFCNELRDFRINHRIAMVVVHHDRKAYQGSPAAMRGASALRAESDASFQLVVAQGRRHVRLVCDKMRHGPVPKSLKLGRTRNGFFDVMGEEEEDERGKQGSEESGGVHDGGDGDGGGGEPRDSAADRPSGHHERPLFERAEKDADGRV